jgi:hypothetical protein
VRIHETARVRPRSSSRSTHRCPSQRPSAPRGNADGVEVAFCAEETVTKRVTQLFRFFFSAGTADAMEAAEAPSDVARDARPSTRLFGLRAGDQTPQAQRLDAFGCGFGRADSNASVLEDFSFHCLHRRIAESQVILAAWAKSIRRFARRRPGSHDHSLLNLCHGQHVIPCVGLPAGSGRGGSSGHAGGVRGHRQVQRPIPRGSHMALLLRHGPW